MARELVIEIRVEAEKAKQDLAAIERELRQTAEASREGSIGLDLYNARMKRLTLEKQDAIGRMQQFGGATKQAAGELQKASTATDQLLGVVKRYIGPAALGLAVKATLDWAGALEDLSGRTGLSTEALQRLGVVAAKNGSSMQALATSIQMMGDRLYSGDKSAVKAVESLGLNLKALLALDPEQAFRELARAVASVEDPMRKNALVTDLFGRSGRELIPVLEEVAKGLDQKIPAASAHAIAALDLVGDAWVTLKQTAKVAMAEILAAALTMPQQISPLLGMLAPLLGQTAGRESGQFAGRRQGALGLGDISVGQFTSEGAIVSSVRAGQRDRTLGAVAAVEALDLGQQYQRVLGFVRDLTDAQRASIRAGREMGLSNQEVAKSLQLTGAAADYAEQIVSVYEKQLSATGKTTKKLKEETQDWLATFREGYSLAAPNLGRFSKYQGGALIQPGVLELMGTATRGSSLNAYGTPLAGLTGQQTGVTPYDPFAEPTSPGFWSGAYGGASGFGGGIASTMLGAFMGGGDVGQSVGGFIGSGIGTGVVKQFSASFAKTFLGGALSSILPGVGALLGPLVSWVGDLFGGQAKKTRQMRDQWIEAAGGLGEVRQMAEYAGISIDKLLSTKKTKTFEAEVKKLEAAFAAAQKRVQALLTDLGTLAQRGGLVSGDLARRLTADLDKPEVQQAFQQFVEQNLSQATEGLTRYLEAAKGLPLSAKSAAALGAALAGIWQQSMALGKSAREALLAMLPAIQALEQRLVEAGLSGGAAFGLLLEQATLATDAIAGPLIDGVDGLTQAMVGLANAGLLTQDMFEGLAEQVGVTYQKLIAQGVSAEAALRAIAPSLQRIYELQQKYGWAVDDATQALIDQGKEAGLVGDHMKDVMSQVLDVLKAIAKVLGADIPNAAADAADAIGAIPVPEVPDYTRKPPAPDYGDGLPSYQLGSSGVQNFGAGTLAMLHGREAVLTEAQLKALLEARGGGGAVINISIQALDTQSVRTAVEQEIAPQLVQVLRQNVRGLRTDTQLALGVR